MKKKDEKNRATNDFWMIMYQNLEEQQHQKKTANKIQTDEAFHKCEQPKDGTNQFRTIMYQNNQCVPSVGHHSLDPAQPALVSVGPLSVVVQVDMSLKSNLTYTVLTKKKHQNVK